jgi:hypothetical protein
MSAITTLAFAREAARAGLADALGAAGDDADAAGQAEAEMVAPAAVDEIMLKPLWYLCKPP